MEDQSSSTPSRRSSFHSTCTSASTKRSASLRWKNVIRQVLDTKPEQEEEQDVVGEHMARLLNQHDAFRSQSENMDDEEISFHPLLSSKNLQRWYASIRTFRLSNTTARDVATSIHEFMCFLVKERCSLWTGLRVLLWVSLLAAFLLALGGGAVIVQITHATMVVATMLSALLVDWNDVKQMCPKPVVSLLDAIVSIWKWTDGTLLRGNEYTKRYVEAGEVAMSQGCTSLLKCPPPEGMRRGGKRSTNHAMAIHFCHTMLKHEQKQQSKRNALKRAESSLMTDGDQRESLKQIRKSNKPGMRSMHLSLMSLEEQDEVVANNQKNSEIQGLEIVTSKSADSNHHFRPEKSNRGVSDESSVIRRTLSDSDMMMGVLSDDESIMSGRGDGRSRLGQASDLSDAGDDMDWSEVGARIGMRILSSEHVQRAVASQDTAERILDISKKVEKKFGGTPSRSSEPANAMSFHGSSGKFRNADTTSDANASLLDARGIMTPIKPVHSMWTSAASAVPSSRESEMSSFSDVEDIPEPPSPVPSVRRLILNIQDGDLPPISPRTSLRTSFLMRQGSGGSSSSRGESFQNMQWQWSEPEPLTTIESRDEEAPSTPEILTRPCDAEDQNRSMEVVLMKDKLGAPTEHICPSEISTAIPSATSSAKEYPQRSLLLPGVKVVVPIFPIHPGVKTMAAKSAGRSFQMATVISSRRIHVRTTVFPTNSERQSTNCLSITVSLDKSFLRDGAFAEMTLRIMDSWSDRYMPRHSKFPIGSCVATTFGVGVLVGWRVEDDCHLVRGLWQRRGAGSGKAYLNRDALHATVQASIGFPVDTNLGRGTVVSYVSSGRDFKEGRYCVEITEACEHTGERLEFDNSDILECRGPAFVPVIELIREAAEFQLQVDTYEAAMRRQLYNNQEEDEKKWRSFSAGFETIWHAFLKAVEEDEEFDNGVNEFFANIISFLDQLENNDTGKGKPGEESQLIDTSEKTIEDDDDDASSSGSSPKEKPNPFAWFVDDLFGGVFGPKEEEVKEEEEAIAKSQWNKLQYDKAYAVIRSLMRTVTMARADCKQQPNLKLTLSVVYEFLLFVRTVIKIQQKNVSAASVAVWERAIEEIVTTFGPVKARLQKIGEGIADRVQKHGNRAKIRIIRFVDIVVSDETLLRSLERGEWDICLTHLEQALVQARIIDEASRENYHKTIQFVLSHFSTKGEGSAAARNNKKIVRFAKVLKWMASPRRSFLKLMRANSMLEILQGIFVRVFQNNPVASRMISIHAFNMTSLRQLRMLKDFTIAGKLWIPILEAADKELLFAVAKMPETSKRIMVPLSKLFTLGVAQFRVIGRGDLTADWMDFLMEDQAIKLIHEIDVELILSVESFSKDVKEVLTVLPYYASIDDDILNLMDEVDVDEFLTEAADAITDAERLAQFIREKCTIAIQRFLDYLPKMSIPVEHRELGDGWVISCHSETGGDLTLSDVNIKRENLTCQVMGGETIFFPMFAGDDSLDSEPGEVEIVLLDELRQPLSPLHPRESSILDHIRELLINAQQNGCWEPGIGGVGQQPTDRYVATVLKGIPVSTVLNTGIELWRSLEIDDDELLEIAIKDVSFQIQLQKEHEEGIEASAQQFQQWDVASPVNAPVLPDANPRRRFNPRVDPTLVYLEMKRLTVNLDKFRFRIEKVEKTIFDPVFEGWGTVSIQDVSIKLRVDCRKERLKKMGTEMTVPVLQCRELEVKLEKVKFKVKDTGADWILNKAVSQWGKDITDIVETNLKQQVRAQVAKALENLNSYFQINPDLMLNILGITMDDLEENLVSV
jgi:hypothetical protein